MLQFIYGGAATGKTYTVFERIKQDISYGKDVALLVPEQFTFESERTLLHTLGDKASTNVSVLSFTRLYDEVCRNVGGRTADLINEYDKVILMSRAMRLVEGELALWGKYASSSKFIETMLKTINELKNCAVTPSDISLAIEKIEEGYLRAKLKDLLLIFTAYEALLGNRFLDPVDNLTRLYQNLEAYKYFQNKTVYIDSFKNFTGQQYKIIDRILSQAESVTICFTAVDLFDYQKIDLFTNVRDTAKRILQSAEKYSVPLAEPLVLEEQHYKNSALKNCEEMLSKKSVTDLSLGDEVTLCKCKTVFDEAEFCARTIKKLVREQNYRFRDFVIIARNAEKYKKAIQNACQKNGVFLFADEEREITYLPLTIFIGSALSLVKSFSSQTVFNLLKTGCGPLDEDEISELENYVYLWNIKGSVWRDEWDMNPTGLDINTPDDAKAILDRINSMRQRVVAQIDSLKYSLKGTPTQMAGAVVDFLIKNEVDTKLSKIYQYYNEVDNPYFADSIRQSWDIVMDILDGIVKCLPDNEITLDEFVSSWEQSIKYATISNIPQMLDEVTFGSADRIKPSRPKIAFIIGANHGEFPSVTKSNGIFGNIEREKLKNSGVDLLINELTFAVDEEYLVYTSLCCATDRLYITYSQYDSKGSELPPSEIVTDIMESFESYNMLNEPRKLSKENLPETVLSAAVKMCELYGSDKSAAYSIDEALKSVSDFSIQNFSKTADKTEAEITDDVAKRLYGKNIYMSASKFDTYHRCKFSFFCKYGVKAYKLQPADFDVLQRGTIVHYVMENAISDYGKDISKLTRKETDELTDKYIEQYLSLVGGFAKIVNARIKFLIGKISIAAKDVLYHLAKEFAQADFEPKYCELKIGKDETVPAVKIPFGEDGSFIVNGSIDRVDTWNGFLRVVDYKTGTKKFALSDTLMGLNLQMLIYLYSVIRGENSPLKDHTPAGVLYMPSKREKEGVKLTMNGIVLDDDEVISAMEKQNEGEYIPKHTLDKNGDTAGNTYISGETFNCVFDYIEKLMSDMGESIIKGDAQAVPVDGKSKACDYCDYYSVCCIENAPHIKVPSLKNHEVIAKMKEALDSGN